MNAHSDLGSVVVRIVGDDPWSITIGIGHHSAGEELSVDLGQLLKVDPEAAYSRLGKSVLALLALHCAPRSIPAALGSEIDEACQAAEVALRKLASSNLDARLDLVMHLAAEARRQRSATLLDEAQVLFDGLVDRGHPASLELNAGMWQKLREETLRIASGSQ